MKKTFTINIAGTVFYIEEDAYEKLQNYILKLKQHFGAGEEGNEIISDIEARIAELFSEKSDDKKTVVTMAWVDEVIEVMGTPEDIMEAEVEDDEEPVSAKRKRRLYRDPDHRVIGGVCGGLGAYFNMDPVILRIIFVVLFLINGIGLIAYLILWIAVPKALNTAQRLEMRGQEVTVSNIQKSIKEEVKEVKESYQKFKESDGYNKGKQGVSQFGEFVYTFFKVILKIIVVIIGVVLILSGFLGLLGFVSSLIVGHSFVNNWPLIWTPELHMPGFLNQFVSTGSVTAGLITIALLVGIPLLAMLFIGTKLVFRYKSNNSVIALSMIGVWFLALIALIAISAGQVGNFKSQTSLSSSESLDCGSCQTLYLDVNENDRWDEYSKLDWDINEFKVVLIDGEERLLGDVSLDVEKSSTDNFIIVVKKHSRGKNNDDAKDNIEDIIYSYSLKDSTVFFDPYFLIDENGRWRDQSVDIVVKVPVGKSIYLNSNMDEIIHDIDNVSNTWDSDMVGKFWEMKPEGLTMKESSDQ
ncbi:MAG: PspC domain-containing protein [Prolixibacteraceae bacterium]|nr:PspC domain-containing protein [Prolixibacteraceae bacterium]MBN2773891.1 PspC domain-containing protein [Prolixibacteraceae bacterium]